MGVVETIPLNEYGMAAWKHYCIPTLFVTTPYSWVDRYIMIDESDGRRTVVMEWDDETFHQICGPWEPITTEEYKKVKRCFRDIYSDE